jgi:hypothetical protein
VAAETMDREQLPNVKLGPAHQNSATVGMIYEKCPCVVQQQGTSTTSAAGTPIDLWMTDVLFIA